MKNEQCYQGKSNKMKKRKYSKYRNYSSQNKLKSNFGKKLTVFAGLLILTISLFLIKNENASIWLIVISFFPYFVYQAISEFLEEDKLAKINH